MTFVHSDLNRAIASAEREFRRRKDIDGGGGTDHFSYVRPFTLEAFQ